METQMDLDFKTAFEGIKVVFGLPTVQAIFWSAITGAILWVRRGYELKSIEREKESLVTQKKYELEALKFTVQAELISQQSKTTTGRATPPSIRRDAVLEDFRKLAPELRPPDVDKLIEKVLPHTHQIAQAVRAASLAPPASGAEPDVVILPGDPLPEE
jgi:hypothetical protein